MNSHHPFYFFRPSCDFCDFGSQRSEASWHQEKASDSQLLLAFIFTGHRRYVRSAAVFCMPTRGNQSKLSIAFSLQPQNLLNSPSPGSATSIRLSRIQKNLDHLLESDKRLGRWSHALCTQTLLVMPPFPLYMTHGKTIASFFPTMAHAWDKVQHSLLSVPHMLIILVSSAWLN